MKQPRSRGEIVMVHWNEEERAELVRPLKADGWRVKTNFDLKDLKASPPVAVVISLRRLPSHGREVAYAIWHTRWGRAIPILFLDGEKDKVTTTRLNFPAAHYVTSASIVSVLRKLGNQQEGR